MAIFPKRKPDSDAELERLRHRRRLLDQQRSAAEQRLAEAIAERRTRLVESDLDNGQAPKAVTGRLRDEADAITDALATIDRKIAEVEERLAAERVAAERQAEAERRRVQIEAARRASTEFAATAERLIAELQLLIPTSMQVGAAAANVKYFVGQLAIGTEAGLAEAAVYCQRVLAGNVMIAGTPPPPKPEPPPPAPVERMLVYLLTDGMWPEPDGSMRYACQYGQASPPVDVARRAIAANLADPFDSPRSVRLREINGMPFSVPHPSSCTNLLTGEQPQPEGDNGTSAAPAEYFGPPMVGVAVAASRQWR
jgi:hypothetical protein